ncbi:MAG: 4-alpha-glucanotransferase [Clostridia bacterium]|nr:4-alpha-glucanotransferase [Clostridia bacterium]MBQ7363962.1 4-alpha-glucanotransferase [Clostridia bacterium]
MKKRASGVLMHVSSLPGDYSVGSFGGGAYKFIDFLADAGFSYWQVLPFCMPDECGSPYKSKGSFSVNPWFIDLPILKKQGLITDSELDSARQHSPYLSEYARLPERMSLLRRAAERVTDRERVEEFIATNGELSYTARYLAIAEEQGDIPHRLWRDVQPSADTLFFHKFLIYEFCKQWQGVKSYANSRGISVIGDMPIYAAYESADVWARPEAFLLDGELLPRSVAGVPPDYFAKEGQLWGNPLYNWRGMRERGFDFFRARMENALSLFDGVRIDHFRALDAYYSIPSAALTAKEGKWIKGPGRALVRALRDLTKNKLVIAEDLGDITDSVRDLVRYSGYPGMRVLQFGFMGEENSIHLPHNYTETSFAYTGTHDNNTLLGFIWESDSVTRARIFDYFGIRHNDWSLACEDIIRCLLASSARAVILPVQDLLGFGADTRMNTPGVPDGNWRFRITEDNLRTLSENSGKYRYLNNLYGR